MGLGFTDKSFMMLHGFCNQDLPPGLMSVLDILKKFAPGWVLQDFVSQFVLYGLGQDTKEQCAQRRIVALEVAAIHFQVLFQSSSSRSSSPFANFMKV